MSVTLYVPRDASAVSVGAEEVARAVCAEARRREIDVRVVRNGSRGLLWLEPLVEVAAAHGRIGYGPVAAPDVAELFDASFLEGGAHPLRLRLTEEIPYLKNQQRLTFARVGVIDPVSLDDYLAHDGYAGLRRALTMGSGAIVQAIAASGLRGRGGAAFPAGIKWRTVLEQRATPKYITCNADEGDSGTFSDRMLMEGDPYALIEGMTIAGVAVGATRGFIYLRAEYPHAHRALQEAIGRAYERNYLGHDILGAGKAFDLEVRLGAGAYICGEETSMLDSLEGKRGEVRVRPPLPAIKGLFGQPTLVHNVISLGSVPTILHKGAEFYANFGVGKSRGTIPLQLGGNIRCGG
ncbi:MAG: formate dehydrogenase beta subunit, partial [Lysobacterales bacterium]